ncbi:MAG: hypothetical protein AT712_01790 [Caldivirga sp. CIS_19]|nr:MAG: hypothetical protein AT712_01790 [Caldivirga sp. CIS_19]
MGLPILSTSALTMRGCSRESVYRLFRRLLRIRDKLGKNIKLLELGGIKAYLRFSRSKGSIYVYDGYMVSKDDCDKVGKCVMINNVSLLYMYMMIRLTGRNMALLNIPDALIWVSKVFGKDTMVSILDLTHDYIESGVLSSDVDVILGLINMLGLRVTRQQFENAVLPAKRILHLMREHET